MVDIIQRFSIPIGVEIIEDSNLSYSNSKQSLKESLYILINKCVSYYKECLNSKEGNKIAYSYQL